MKKPKSRTRVQVYGFASGPTGWSTHSSNFARALNKITPVSLRLESTKLADILSGPVRGPLLRAKFSGKNDFKVFVTGEPEHVENTSRWIVWETTVLSDEQKRLCDSTQFLWTPTSWGRRNLMANGIEGARIAVVPEGVDTDFYRPATPASGRFRFLTVGKWETRKFFDGLLKAFTEEFSAEDDVELYLQCHNNYVPNFSLNDKVAKAGFSSARNIVLGAPCSLNDLRALYQSANCFVLPTRAEGWGLPILESMACGVPAIVTRYSAPLDYLDENNSYLIDVAKMVEAHDDDFNIHTGLWAEPDIPHLRRLMRNAFEDRSQLREKGLRARATAEQFTWDNSARVALDAIRKHLAA
jgi:glycosyltransferase involved in cell wall biosynthesis